MSKVFKTLSKLSSIQHLKVELIKKNAVIQILWYFNCPMQSTRTRVTYLQQGSFRLEYIRRLTISC